MTVFRSLNGPLSLIGLSLTFVKYRFISLIISGGGGGFNSSPSSECRTEGIQFALNCPVTSLTCFQRNELSLFSLIAFSKKSFLAERMRSFVLLRQNLKFSNLAFMIVISILLCIGNLLVCWSA